MSNLSFPARLIRLRDAPAYLGMDRNRFNDEVRPLLTQVPIGKQGIAFDRHQLDRWADQLVAKYRHSSHIKITGSKSWEARAPRVSAKEAESGILTKSSSGSEFAKAVAQVNSIKQRPS